jgi:pyruvate dehydrogenase E2 component (dihydrolipoamide acetyltransferase)
VADFLMPSLGADMDAGTLARWCRGVGERIDRGEIIAEVETDKGIVEVEVYASGVVEALLVEPGTKVPVGTRLAVLRQVGAAEADASTKALPSVGAAVLEAIEVAPPAAHGLGDDTERAAGVPTHATPAARLAARQQGIALDAIGGSGRHGTITVSDVESACAQVSEPPERDAARAASPPGDTATEATGRVRISPLARRRASELGLPLEGLDATGPEGSVVLADVERAAAERKVVHADAHASLPTLGAAPPDAKMRMRQAIAASMARSKREIPHYYVSHTIDLEPSLAWLERENAGRSLEARLLPAVLLLRAVVRAAQKFPEINGHCIDGVAKPATEVHLGVAVALRGGGLVAPAILSAQSLELDALMARLGDLVARARAGKLRASEMGSATLTVTSLGERGVEAVFPVIVPPQVAMVGFGAILKRPFVVGESVLPRRVITVSLAADHRVSDGHRGGLFLAAIAAELEKAGAP